MRFKIKRKKKIYNPRNNEFLTISDQNYKKK